MDIDVKLDITNIRPYDLQLEAKGFYIRYKKNTYFITLNHGFSIKEMTINKEDICDYTNCLWNEIVFCKKTCEKGQFVFSSFLVKQIDSIGKFFINNTELKYIENEYLPLNMLPENPLNLYYKFEIIDINADIGEGLSGSAIYDNKKRLVGIFSKIENNYIYVIPTYYILKSLDKDDNNNIYTINKDIRNIKKIDFNLIKNNKIYHNSLKINIPIDCFLNLELDKNKKLNIIEYGKNKIIKASIFKTKFNNSFEYTINDNTIKCSSSFLRYLKEIHFDELKKNFKFILNKKKFNINLNQEIYKIIF